MNRTLVTTLIITAVMALYWLYPESPMSAPQVEAAIGSPSDTSKGIRQNPSKARALMEKKPTRLDSKVEEVSAQHSAPEYLPPIVKNNTQTPRYQGDLDDHQAYLQHQGQQEQELKRAYVSAAKDKVAELKKLLARGEREGINQEQLEFARNKINALKQMQRQLEAELATAK